MVGLLEIDPVVSIDFDLAIMMRGCQHENEQVEKYRHRGPGVRVDVLRRAGVSWMMGGAPERRELMAATSLIE